MPSSGELSPVGVLENGTQFMPLPNDDETLWDAIEIIKEKKNLYLVRWDGKDPATGKPWKPSWVPKQDCTNELIRDWKLKKAKTVRTLKRRGNDDAGAQHTLRDEVSLIYSPPNYNPTGFGNFSKGGSKSKSPSASVASHKSSSVASHKPSSVATDQSKLHSSVPSSEGSPIVEITHRRKRPWGRRRPDVDLTEEDADSEGPNRKKRKLDSPLGHDEQEEQEESVYEDNHGMTYWQPTVIESPTKQLDKALGLLHRKSEEIECLENDSKALHSKIKSLEDRLSAAERQYGEVCANLDMERMRRTAAEETPATHSEQLIKLLQENERLDTTNKSLESDNDLLRDLYGRASDAHQTVLAENTALVRDNQSLREQATTGVKQAGVFWKARVQTLETELARMRGTVKVFAEQARHTDNEVRSHAALLPMAQKDTLDALDKVEWLKDKVRELGRENTSLRIQVKEWEDDAMAQRKKAMEVKRREEDEVEDEVVWVCHWIDAQHQTKCAALLESREKLYEHLIETGHI